MNRKLLQDASWRLVSKAGFDNDASVEVLAGGANNRVYKVSSGNASVLLKEYFRDRSDPRNRCTVEFSFCQFAWDQGIRCVPQPLEVDPESEVALYQYMVGQKLSAYDVSHSEIDQALAFLYALNLYRHSKQAHQLKDASEACFSLHSHTQCTDRRVRNLVDATSEPAFDPMVRSFVISSLCPTWQKVRSEFQRQVQSLRLEAFDEISVATRRLSPSDFGFHNALKLPQGQLCFVDFEHAGWDDVAKTVCDFFLQPAVPVPTACFERFVNGVLNDFEDKHAQAKRIELLFPIYRLKWCCILLNDFLPAGDQRRKFSLGTEDDSVRKAEQLEKAADALNQIDICHVVK